MYGDRTFTKLVCIVVIFSFVGTQNQYYFQYLKGSTRRYAGSNFPNEDDGLFGNHTQIGSRIGPAFFRKSNDELIIFGGRGFDIYSDDGYVNNLISYSVSQNKFKYIGGDKRGSSYASNGKAKPDWPGGRKNSLSFQIDINKIGIIAAGTGLDSSNEGFLSDVWQLDLENYTFSTLTPNNLSVNLELSHTIPYFPGGREYAAGWLINDPPDMFIGFGGRDKDYQNRNDMFSFDLNSHTYDFIKGSSIPSSVKPIYTDDFSDTCMPGSRKESTFWSINSTFHMLFGGWGAVGGFMGGNTGLSDCFLYDSNRNEFKYIGGTQDYPFKTIYEGDNQTPGGRERGLAWAQTNEISILFGGYSFGAYLVYGPANDVFQLNITSKKFKFLAGEVVSTFSYGIYPTDEETGEYITDRYTKHGILGGRQYAAGWMINPSKFILFGGTGADSLGFEGALGDIWALELLPACYGLVSFEKDACSGSSRGKCVSSNKCECKDPKKYFGDECQYTSCYGKATNDTENQPCNYPFGKCVNYDKCECEKFYHGKECSILTCFKKLSNNSKVCSSHGKCVGKDTCLCQEYSSGETCGVENIWMKYNFYFLGGIVGTVSIVFLVLCVIFSVCLLCVISLGKLKKRLKKYDDIDDIDIMLEEKQIEMKNNDDVRLKINKRHFVIAPDEVSKPIRLLGEGGGDASVFLVKYQNMECAFKVFRSISFLSGDTESDNQEFEREMSLCVSLKHPYILQVYGCIVNKPRIGIVMEYAKKGDFEEFIKAHKALKKKKMILKEKVRILKECCTAINFLHKKKIIHRDIKPKNLFLDEKKTCKLADFGLSKSFERSVTKTKMIGTPLYMASEIYFSRDYTEKVDVFSFAMMIFTTVTENFYPLSEEECNRLIRDGNFRPKVNPKDFAGFPILKKIMERGWCHDQDKRANSEQILKMFESINV